MRKKGIGFLAAMVYAAAAILAADVIGGYIPGKIGSVCAAPGTGSEEEVFEYTIEYSKAMLDNCRTNLKIMYTFSPVNAAKLDMICDEAKKFLDKNPTMDSSERMSYVSTIKSKMEMFASDYGTKDIPHESVSGYIGLYGDWVIPTAVYGEKCAIILPVINYSDENLYDVVVTPKISVNASEWPFEIEKEDYSQVILALPCNFTTDTIYEHRQEVGWFFTARSDVPSGYYELKFDVKYERNGKRESAEISEYVYIKGSPQADRDNDGGHVSIPRIIVTGFDTDPEKIYAGDTFTLVLHIKNTSNETTVSNILFDLQAASGTEGNGNSVGGVAPFLPTSGSSTIFCDSIAPGSNIDIKIEMTARGDLAQKPYVLNVNMNYEDDRANPYSQSANVSIPIYQESKCDIGSMEIMPGACGTYEQANVMFSIHNTGKTTLYNVQVKFDQTYVSGGDVYVGKLESGQSGNVDTMVTAIMPNDGIVTAYITFEDENGTVTTVEEEMNLYIYEMMYEDPGMYDPWIDDPTMAEAQTAKKKPVWIWIAAGVGGAAVIAVIVTVAVVKNKKKKKLLAEINSSDDELL